MKRLYRRYWSALTGQSDTVPRGHGEVRALQWRAWDEEGLLVVSCQDERLDDEDCSDLYRIAERLFRNRESRS